MADDPDTDEHRQRAAADGDPLDYAPARRRRRALLSPTAAVALATWSKRTLTWSARILLTLVIGFALIVGFGTSKADAEKMRAFAQAVERWQTNPDFRQVQVEYVELGSESMRTKLAFVDSTTAVMFLRSLPGLPEHLRVNDTSLLHYTNFTRGPLSAYMHLTTEQGLTDTLKMLRYLGSKEQLTDEDIHAFIRQYKLHNPVANDAGAVESVRSLIDDVNAGTTFAVAENVAPKMTEHIAAIATALNYPPGLNEMTPAQQREVWQRLDDEVKATDYELWRTKQVNDWLNGVWAQVYGTMYSGVIAPILLIRDICRVAGPLLLMAWVGAGIYRRRRVTDEQPGQLGARLALEGGKDLPEP